MNDIVVVQWKLIVKCKGMGYNMKIVSDGGGSDEEGITCWC